ncbi:unnamed protein product, partial [Ixodes hexagonus]
NAGTSGVQQFSAKEVPVIRQDTGFDWQLELLPRSVQEALQAGGALLTRDRLELVRTIANGMTRKSSRPPRGVIKQVAEGLVRKFSASLEDRGIDGQVIGTGYDSLFRQLENRIENMNRGKRSTHPQDQDPLPKRRSAKCSYGCLNWQPVMSERGEAHDINEEKEWMKREAHKATKDVQMSRAIELLRSRYPEQRAYINSTEPVHCAKDVKEEWPLLFHKPLFYTHVDILLGKNMKVSSLLSNSFTYSRP